MDFHESHSLARCVARAHLRATQRALICDVYKGLHVVFNARTQGLVPSSNSDARKILLRSLSPEYADGTLTQSM